MDITWFGHACFRVRERGVTIVADPYSKEIGYSMPRVRADVVTVSHGHSGHGWAQATRGHPRVLQCAGEYEIGGVFITAVPTFHDASGGQERGQNLTFVYDFGDLTACHLGDLGHILDQEQMEAVNGVNVLLAPVGGGSGLSASQAADLVAEIEPNIVIPMHYRLPGLDRDLAPVDGFLKAMGVPDVEAQEMLRVRRSSLPEGTQVVVLQPRGTPIEG